MKMVTETTRLQIQMIKGSRLRIVLLKPPPREQTNQENKIGMLLKADKVYNRTVMRNKLRERGRNHAKKFVMRMIL